MSRFTIALILCGLFFMVVGCGPNNAEGIPKLTPASVKVTSDGQPLADVSVDFAGAEGLAVGGTTDATGTAVISTHRGSFVGEGAPAGEYKVTLKEKGPTVRSLSIEEKDSMSDAEKKAYDKEVNDAEKNWKPQLPKSLTSLDKTPLSVSVAASGENVTTIEVKDYAK